MKAGTKKRRKPAAERKVRAVTVLLSGGQWDLFEASRKILGVSASQWARILIIGAAGKWLRANPDGGKNGTVRNPSGM